MSAGTLMRYLNVMHTLSEEIDEQNITPLEELHAFYGDLTEDTISRLCETFRALEIDDSSCGGVIRSHKTKGERPFFIHPLRLEILDRRTGKWFRFKSPSRGKTLFQASHV